MSMRNDEKCVIMDKVANRTNIINDAEEVSDLAINLNIGINVNILNTIATYC